MTRNIADLEKQIERLVHEHIAACQMTATAAVSRAFGSPSSKRPKTQRSARVRAAPSRRRPPSEVAALGEQLYEAVCAHPGEAMTVLAAQVGEGTRELNRPMTLLKRAGRVRSVGQRQHTRYFPMAAKASQSA